MTVLGTIDLATISNIWLDQLLGCGFYAQISPIDAHE
jgi:hypothetical protein